MKKVSENLGAKEGHSLRMAFVTHYDVRDVHFWSGTPLWMANGFREHGTEIDFVGPIDTNRAFLSRVKFHFYKRLFGRIYLMNRDAAVFRDRAIRAQKILQALPRPDVIFTTYPDDVAFLDDDRPIVLCHDATWSGLLDFYPGYEVSTLAPETVRDGHLLEKAALDRCTLALYSSQWAADSAIRDYGCEPSKIRVIPFGANMECNRTADDVEAIIAGRDRKKCRLLWVGVDWERKGGAFAVQVAVELNRAGVPAELTLIGAQPPAGTALPDCVRSLGFISKSQKSGQEQIDALYRESHFLVLPTKADCTPVVFCEASSYGLPSLAPDVGGVSSVVRSGRNGQVFSLSDSAMSYASFIKTTFSDPDTYRRLATASFLEYRNSLNWRVATRSMLNEMRAVV
jgi:glycosyltransferase involved in cell wall biosynthesis